MTDNPNAYDDERWATAAIKVSTTIGSFWEAGATLEDIEDAVATGMAQAADSDFNVTITPKESN